ncbi:hypothetical protein CYMTET_3697 [Cymbomonas tetramitiformis]|uniref:Uncharacterized protein n=1 Tax=Cymbomonas tetramitiformis TaxID=36881 RepID=A0AAE0LKS8_9CHLO|nr:hypothetical protein CYMTET_3697 [Cymbomonas tetramitiformis]
MLFQKAGGELTKAATAVATQPDSTGGIANIMELYGEAVGLLNRLARGTLDRNTAVGFGVCEMVYQRWLRRQERDGKNYAVMEKQLAAVVEDPGASED